MIRLLIVAALRGALFAVALALLLWAATSTPAHP